jgi:RNA polymerase sigma-70 factor (ECF subfamily)
MSAFAAAPGIRLGRCLWPAETLHFSRMGEAPTDEELMLRYCEGDAAAFDVLYRRHRGPMYRFLLRQAGDAAAAEEVFQDVWMRVVNSRARYEVRAKFTSWVYAIAHNRLMDFYRANGRAVFLDQEESEAALEALPAENVAADVRLDRKRAVERLLVALADLPAVQREAFLMQQEGDLSLEEIAAATGVNRETVKSRLRYALAKLRASLSTNASANASTNLREES